MEKKHPAIDNISFRRPEKGMQRNRYSCLVHDIPWKTNKAISKRRLGGTNLLPENARRKDLVKFVSWLMRKRSCDEDGLLVRMASTHRADVCSVAQEGQNSACGVLETLLLHRCRNGTRPGIGERSKECTPDRGIVSGLRLQRTVVISEVVQGVLQGAGKVADRTAARSIRRLHWTRRRREDDDRRIMAWLASAGLSTDGQASVDAGNAIA